MTKAFEIRTYAEKKKAMVVLAAVGPGRFENLKVANCGGILPSYDRTVVDMKFEDPFGPGIAPTTTFSAKHLRNHPDRL